MFGLVWRLFRLRRTLRTIDAILAGDLEALLRRRLVGRLAWLPLYRTVRRRKDRAVGLRNAI